MKHLVFVCSLIASILALGGNARATVARVLGTTISGSPSSGIAGSLSAQVFAVASGNKLYQLDPATLADTPGFPVTLDGSVHGRPMYGAMGGEVVVAVGTDKGTLEIFKAVDGTRLVKEAVGGNVSTPAITADGRVIFGTESLDGPVILYFRQPGGGLIPLTLWGTHITASPAVTLSGYIVIGTDAAFFDIRSDGTPQMALPVHTTTAPLLYTDGIGFVTSGQPFTLLQFAAVNGQAWPPLSLPPGVSLFNGFLSYGGCFAGYAAYPSNTGDIYLFKAWDDGPKLMQTVHVSAAGFACSPIIIGCDIYSVDTLGHVRKNDVIIATINGTPSPAMAAVQFTASYLCVANTTGTVWSIPY